MVGVSPGELLQQRGTEDERVLSVGSFHLEVPLSHTRGWEVPTCGPGTGEDETGDQFRLCSETLSINKSTHEIENVPTRSQSCDQVTGPLCGDEACAGESETGERWFGDAPFP